MGERRIELGTFSAFLSDRSCFSSTAMLSLRFFTMSAGDLWDLPNGNGMVTGYQEQQRSEWSTCPCARREC